MSTLTLDDREKEELNKWWEEHKNTTHGGEEPYGGAIGGIWVFTYCGTGLGPVTKVHCAICEANDKKKEATKDLTDYDSW